MVVKEKRKVVQRKRIRKDTNYDGFRWLSSDLFFILVIFLVH